MLKLLKSSSYHSQFAGIQFILHNIPKTYLEKKDNLWTKEISRAVKSLRKKSPHYLKFWSAIAYGIVHKPEGIWEIAKNEDKSFLVRAGVPIYSLFKRKDKAKILTSLMNSHSKIQGLFRFFEARMSSDVRSKSDKKLKLFSMLLLSYFHKIISDILRRKHHRYEIFQKKILKILKTGSDEDKKIAIVSLFWNQDKKNESFLGSMEEILQSKVRVISKISF